MENQKGRYSDLRVRSGILAAVSRIAAILPSDLAPTNMNGPKPTLVQFAANDRNEPRAAIENVQTRSTLPGNVELLTMNNETKTGSEDDSLLDS